MVEKTEDRKLIIKGRVDSINAQTFEGELMALCRSGEEVLIDASDLTYISSAGLRVFMRLKKAVKKDVIIENVSNEVYDIFEVTGFTEILNIKKKIIQKLMN